MKASILDLNSEKMKLCKKLVRSIKKNHSRLLIEYKITFISIISFILKQHNQNDNEKMGEGNKEKAWREECP